MEKTVDVGGVNFQISAVIFCVNLTPNTNSNTKLGKSKKITNQCQNFWISLSFWNHFWIYDWGPQENDRTTGCLQKNVDMFDMWFLGVISFFS